MSSVPGNLWVNNKVNPTYKSTFTFNNDFSSLNHASEGLENKYAFIKAKSEKEFAGCLLYSKHQVSLAELSVTEIEDVSIFWQNKY